MDQLFDEYQRPSYSGEIQNEVKKHSPKPVQPVIQ